MARTLDVTVRTEPGGAVFSRRFTRFISDLTDLSPAFEQMEADYFSWQRAAFASRGASSGSAWAPLSPGYARQKARQYPGATILIRTGRLMRSLTAHHAAGNISVIGPRRMELGTDVPYGGFHQGGTRRMTARPIIRLTAANKATWTKTIHRHLLASATGRLATGTP